MINAEFSRMKRRFRFFCIENAEQVDAMSLHCIGRRNVESIVWSAWGSVGAGVDKIRQNSPFFVYFVVRSGWI